MSAYDYGRWGEWHQRVFPTLEATLLAAGLSRTLGIVCFHPCYLTPFVLFVAVFVAYFCLL